MQLDPFTTQRLLRFIHTHRARSGQLPTLRDFESNGLNAEIIKKAEDSGVIEKFYVTLTNGTIVKGYKIAERS